MYPLFLGVAQWLAGVPVAETLSNSAAGVVRDLQCVLGLLAACFVYLTLRTLGVRKNVALVAGLFFSTLVGTCASEMAIVTPSLSVFSVTLAAWLYAKAVIRVGAEKLPAGLAVGAGLAVSLAALTRPDNLVFFTVIILATAGFAVRSRFVPARAALGRRLLATCGVACISAAPLLLAWMTCNYIGTGRFRMTNMMGVQMTQTVYNMYDQVDAEDQVLGSIMNKYYAATNQHGVNREYVWPAMGELTARAWQMPFLDARDDQRSKLGNWVYNLASDKSRRQMDHYSVAFSDYLARVAWRLIRKNPAGYLHNAVDSFARDSFDFVPKLPSPKEVSDPRAVEGGSVVKNETGWNLICWTGIVQAPILTLFYVVALACVFSSPLILLNRNEGTRVSDVAVVAMGMGTVATFVAFCLLEAYHNQYGTPYLSTLTICGAYVFDNFGRMGGALGLRKVL